MNSRTHTCFAEPWRGHLPPELSDRLDEIHAAAIFLAHAARPKHSSSPYVPAFDYWRTLSVLTQQAHMMRAADATARALGLSWRSDR